MSDSTLANNIGKSIEEAKYLRDVFLGEFKEVGEMIKQKVEFCKRTGYIDSVLGDKILGNKERANRVGINYVCQNSASVILGAGFYNISHHARRLGYQCGAESYIHDSITNLVDVKDLLRIDLLYRKYFRSWCRRLFGIDFKYDLDLGVNFKDKFSYEFDLENMTVELSGTEVDVNYIIKYLEPEKIYMTKDTAEQVCEILNSGTYKLNLDVTVEDDDICEECDCDACCGNDC
jgi:hypothetical protein